jgi:hypothetical protein
LHTIPCIEAVAAPNVAHGEQEEGPIAVGVAVRMSRRNCRVCGLMCVLLILHTGVFGLVAPVRFLVSYCNTRGHNGQR